MMDALREVKEWLFNKFLESSTPNASDHTASRTFRPITPQSIPEFVIPGSNDSSRRTSDCSGPGDTDFNSCPKRNSYGGRSMSPPETPFRMSPSDSVPCLNKIKSNGVCKSAPVTPRHEIRELISGCRNVNSTSVLDTHDTNVDPLSFAAMSLPHFRAQTSYGFSTLSEKPHTRRKESLFHVGSESLLPRKHLSRLAKQSSLSKLHDNCSSESNILASSNQLHSNHSQGKHVFSSSTPSVVITTFSQSRSETPSPEIEINTHVLCSRRLSPTYQAFQGLNKIPLPSRHCRFYNRRRSSLVNLIDQESDKSDKSDKSERSENSSTSGQSTPSQTSIDMSHEPQRRSLGDLAVPKLPSPTMKRHSAPHITERKDPQEEIVKPRSSSCHVISKTKPANHNQLFAPFGELKFSFQYLAASQQLKVTLIKAENLGGQGKQDKNVNPYAKVYLMPGKLQKQISQIFRRTKDPVFNQDMYFQNLSFEEIHKLSLKIKVFSKGTNLKFQEFIGEVTIPLETYDVTEENRMWKDLESRKDREVCLCVSLSLSLSLSLCLRSHQNSYESHHYNPFNCTQLQNLEFVQI